MGRDRYLIGIPTEFDVFQQWATQQIFLGGGGAEGEGIQCKWLVRKKLMWENYLLHDIVKKEGSKQRELNYLQSTGAFSLSLTPRPPPYTPLCIQ
jgi:hypothetical protein